MGSQWFGVLRRLGLASSRSIFVCLLAASALPAQQQVTSAPKLETAKDTNDRIAQLALASTAKQPDYVIGSGDLISIEVFDVPELSREVRVNETGYISLPLIPVKIRGSGLTTFQLQDKIAELLQTNGLVSNPQVTVFMKEQKSEPITVIGAVKSPLVFQAVRQTTLLEVLSQAGGIADDAGGTVIITRAAPAADAAPGATPESGPKSADPMDAAIAAAKSPDPAPPAQTITINLNDLLNGGDPKFNIPLLGGDVVSVPRAGIVYVVGAVMRPGGFVLQTDRDHLTALKVLSLAGGTTNTAKASHAVILRKNPQTGANEEFPVDLQRVMQLKKQDVTLEASDILYVPDSTGKKALHRAGDVAISLGSGVALFRLANY